MDESITIQYAAWLRDDHEGGRECGAPLLWCPRGDPATDELYGWIKLTGIPSCNHMQRETICLSLEEAQTELGLN
jgi:hypothetical protein